MRITSTAAVALIAAFLAACGTQAPTRPSTPQAQHEVVDATPEQVAKCKYLDDVSAVSGSGTLAGAARAGAHREVVNKAAALGATHLVWLESSQVLDSTTTRGRAYRCD